MNAWDMMKEQTEVNLIKSVACATPAIIAAEAATAAVWKMYWQSIRGKRVDEETKHAEARRIGDEAMLCESTCRRMWQELWDKEHCNG
jgi:hypothetical protein